MSLAVTTHALAGPDRDAALAAGDGDVKAFLTWFSAAGAICLIGCLVFAKLAAAMWRRQRIAASPGVDSIEMSVGACIAVSIAIVLGSAAVSIGVAAPLAAFQGLYAASSESGPLEWSQSVCWLISAALALAAAIRVKDREVRALLLLLAGGALLVAARESDLHTKLNPDVIGYWGLHYRRDWWLSGSSPILPRVLWAVIGLLILAAGSYLVWRGAITMFLRGRRHGRLVWTLGAATALMLVAYALDDLLRYRLNLRQSQVCEETIETVACLTYFCAIVWGIRLSRKPARE